MSVWSSGVAEAQGLLRGTRRLLEGRDLSAAAATLTYFAGIAVVPWLLLALWTSSWTAGAGAAQDRLLELRVLVPPDMGARPSYDALVEAATHLGLLGALVVLFPASFYGEGLRRAALELAPHDDRLTGWRARLALMPSLLALPVLAWGFLATGDALVPLAPEGGGGGPVDRVVRIVVGFVAVWLVLAVLLAWVFVVVMPERPLAWVAVAGALGTGSFLAGFLHGFQLFLALPVDVGIPFGGLGVVGGVVAVGLWLYVLHVFVLLGWTATRALDLRVRGGREALA
ncbi:YihY/virulence factor BrkB family protein [Nocardioides sp. ChNu-153]|uniref:YhjD/YihY/BrkB family envelope integrity protein n=1 Tax=unclassified Nocardioides TaxID=2615069 RepID=UPI0024069ED2|nr:MULTISPECIES: YhjD/YihY/BrkB family envelope integrity protein [unclassified Nocardioides]MDF9715734.1 YihY/virulence factor BrkB family protein [Nocardioides sp. ChNu-99]MDN7121839.1 YihY/virulence factor BrkB family protein [Nocardioides sp. ChNu-153]